MSINFILIPVLILTVLLFIYVVKKLYYEKNKLLDSEKFLSIYKQAYDSFAQRAGVLSVERLRYSRAFPPSAFRVKRKSKLTNDQKILLNNYRSFVKKAYGYFTLAILLLMFMFLGLIYLVLNLM